MKKLYVGTILALILLFAPTAFAQSPCGSVCQAYYPCDYACDLCVGDPGLWEVGGGCWGEIQSGTCGDIGQCGWEGPCEPEWDYDESAAYQGVQPQFEYDPCDEEWQYNPATQQYEYMDVCDWNNPYKCTVYGIFRWVRHQNNCSGSPSSETFCLYNNNGSQQYIDRYPGYWDYECCNDSNMWDCQTSFPQCPNL